MFSKSKTKKSNFSLQNQINNKKILRSYFPTKKLDVEKSELHFPEKANDLNVDIKDENKVLSAPYTPSSNKSRMSSQSRGEKK